jgi:Domain of unknown function (DUF4189)
VFMHKKLNFLPSFALFIGMFVVGLAEASSAQVCTPGQSIVKEVAHNEARTGDGPVFSDGEPLVRQTTFTADPGYAIVRYEFVEQRSWGKTSRRIDELAAGTNFITASNVESVKRELTDYIGGKVSILDKIKIDARQRLEQLSSNYLSLSKQAITSNATLQLTLEAIPRSQKRTSDIQGFLRVTLKCVGFTNQNDLRLSLQREVDQILAKGVVPTPTPQRFGAIARSDSTGKRGWAWGFETPQKAESGAIQACGSSDCKSMWFRDNFGALAEADDNAWAAMWGSSREEAEQNALQNCQKNSRRPETCKAVLLVNSITGIIYQR